MFNYKGKEYDRVWFTSDEHYGSSRHIFLSKRNVFETKNIEKEKYLREKNLPKNVKFLLENSTYGATNNIAETPEDNFKKLKQIMFNSMYGMTMNDLTSLDKMCMDMIYNNNLCVIDDDLVFHVGDFGYYKYSELLNGNHILVMGNYEYDECNEKFNGSVDDFRNYIISNFNFIDVIENYTIDTSEVRGFYDISKIYVTHKPMDCIYNRDNNCCIVDSDNKITMNLFGHIHEKCKVKRYGLNVGVDANHFYPVSISDVSFYLTAILKYYDENVFE